MNIQEAKEEIKKTVRAYTARTAAGTFRIPVPRQRPVLLIGPPGIGKTAIMEQIAGECGVGLVSYTMTHHTRQSAIGLPVLTEKQFAGKAYTVTSYTMSEIIASVYEQIEKTGCRDGILFLDEINCVSETLMPAMLQFLQYKTFGSHALPEGWVIVAAGNPPAYNRSAREFDTVTLDRVRYMKVEPDFPIWKHYAVESGLHPAVLSFLELRPERFYVMEPGEKGFVTGRAWEDLSEILLTMEELELGVEEALFGQYLQDEDTATEFTFYYRLYEKWKKELKPEQILTGAADVPTNLPSLPFDERLCIVWLLLQRIYTLGRAYEEQQKLSDSLRFFADGLGQGTAEQLTALVDERLDRRRKSLAVRKENGLLAAGEEEREQRLFNVIRDCREAVRTGGATDAFSERSAQEQNRAERQRKELTAAMQNGAAFVREAFGKKQELVIFLTGLREQPVCSRVLQEELGELSGEAEDFLNAGGKEEELRRKLTEQQA
ncbi:ATP-binding protein [Laedolimicola ammoniilytica]|uniref:AAA family ATPase n=1 Tax=Laedolimicola ammoniilytica TaxID=2981771 RepID=A0ABT2RZ27_9FIRM|nr:AAA family ATPase [Laedolimicola ammoniilytica]MCU6697592.1 AAA family ATPase [Laedolimicola ammoniilytica]SCI35333.1 ATPase family associated with various cellular activities (AAA) [uncultured Clostridium sp.]